MGQGQINNETAVVPMSLHVEIGHDREKIAEEGRQALDGLSVYDGDSERNGQFFGKKVEARRWTSQSRAGSHGGRLGRVCGMGKLGILSK